MTSTEAGAEILPSAADRASFEENGYWIAPRLFDEATVAAAREHMAMVVGGTYERGEAPQVVCRLAESDKALRKIDNSWWADSVIAAVVTSPFLGHIAAELLGVEEIYLWHDQLLWKPGGSGTVGNVGWHQDKHYWTSSSGTDMVTAWVAMDDIHEAIGPMRFLRGSNHWDVLGEGNYFDGDLQSQRERIEAIGMPWDEVPALMSAGQASFHHCKTFHGSGPNTTQGPRRSLAVHMMSGDARLVMGRGHQNEALLEDPVDGMAWRGPRFPRLWPPPA